MLEQIGRALSDAKFDKSRSALVFLSELAELGQHDDAPKWFMDTLKVHMLDAHLPRGGQDVNFPGHAALSLARELHADVRRGYTKALKRRDATPRRAPTSRALPQRTPAQKLEHAVQQALLMGKVSKTAGTVLAWKFKMDGEGPWTLREIVKDNDLDPDVLCGWLCEVIEECPKVGDTCVLGGGAAEITTWERV